MTNIIKGDEVRHGKHVVLEALSKTVIDSMPDAPLSEAMLMQLNDGLRAITPMTAKQVMEAVKAQDGLTFALRLQHEDRIIGACQLSDIDWTGRHAQLCISIVDEAHFTVDMLADVLQTVLQFTYWEANLNRIAMRCLDDNTHLQSALERVGFTNEGRLRQEAYRNGAFMDVLVYSILSREWMQSE